MCCRWGNWGKNPSNTDKIGNLGGLVDENQALTKFHKKISLSQDL